MWLAAAVLNNAVYGTFPLQKVPSDSAGQGFALSVSETQNEENASSSIS